VVFPFELLSFHCPPQADVEIWTHGLGGPELVERLHSEEILIEQPIVTPTAATGSGGVTMSFTTEPTPWLQAG
jgi:hypothetical protein